MDPVAQLNSALTGRYDVEREIGAGGMATVYLARDVKHDRRVALKVLKPELGAVLGVERFLAEIKVTANLQHPNLLPLFDSGAADGLLFYVMPFVEGESLRARLDREKQLPVDEAIRIATAVASALDYAHRHNVIHRDLKPENILLHEGQPVVADFGIALAVSNAGGGRITQTGLSLGTPAYMSPEQATGDRAIDGRTDIYSLGAMTYEMLVGDPPHIASTSQAIIAKVLTERPASVRTSRPNVPEHVAAAIEHALEKLPADRFATAHAFADAVTGKAIVASSATLASASAPARAFWRGTRARIALAGVAVLWMASVVASALIARARVPAASEVKFEVVTPIGASFNSATVMFFAMSPDGQNLAYLGPAQGSSNGTPTIWVRPIGATTARSLVGTNGAGYLAWSPDGRFIAYTSANDRKLYAVDIAGGTPRRVCDVPALTPGIAWNRDNVILFSTTTDFFTVPSSGGTPVKIELSGFTGARRYPVFMPDGRHFLFSAHGPAAKRPGIYASSLDGTSPTFVTDRGTSNVAYTNSELLLYARDGDLYAQSFSTSSMRVSGEPVRVAGELVNTPANGFNSFSTSQNGVLAYRTGAATGRLTGLRWYTRDGKPAGVAGQEGPYSQARLSPDDKQVVLLRADAKSGKSDIWTLDLATNIENRLTFDSSRVSDPTWTPDGRAVAYYASRNGNNELFQKRIGGSSDSAVFVSNENKFPEDISADGRFFLFHSGNGIGAGRLAAVSLGADHKVVALADTTFRKDEGRFSPDGHWVSYGSDESGMWEVRVASFPAFDNQKPVSLRGGVEGRWRADGKELFYLAPDGKVMSVAVKGVGAAAEFAQPVELFQSPLRNPANNVPHFSVSRDGQRFLFLTPVTQDAAAIDPITVVVNWPTGLKRQ